MICLFIYTFVVAPHDALLSRAKQTLPKVLLDFCYSLLLLKFISVQRWTWSSSSSLDLMSQIIIYNALAYWHLSGQTAWYRVLFWGSLFSAVMFSGLAAKHLAVWYGLVTLRILNASPHAPNRCLHYAVR